MENYEELYAAAVANQKRSFEKMYDEAVANQQKSFKISYVMFTACLAMLRTATKEQAQNLLNEMHEIENEKNSLSIARQGIIDACGWRLETIAYEDRHKKIFGI